MKHLSSVSRRSFVVTTLLLSATAIGSAQGRGGWVPLGTAHVDGNADHDRIKVGRHEGTFRRLRLRVIGSAVKFDHIVVHFENGQSEHIGTNFVVRNNSSSPVIDVPGDRRAIESVELWYERGRWSSRPEVVLLGRS